jgi:hypothetical protein
VKNQQIHQLSIQFINYLWYLLHVSALRFHPQGAFLVPYIVDGHFVCSCVHETHNITTHNTPSHNILSTAPQLSFSQKALGTLPEDGNVMLKHVGATIHN